jgi:hypothetical protein
VTLSGAVLSGSSGAGINIGDTFTILQANTVSGQLLCWSP